MDLTDSLAISVSALDAQRHRLNVIATNLANAESTRTPQGTAYKRRDVIFETTPVASKFKKALAKAGMDGQPLQGVRIAGVREDPKMGKALYDPKHPDADKDGMVQMPNVNVLEEMVNMMAASRAYEANVQAISAAKSMWSRALEIGK
jgi:flagellar basal-body rod protein FlgC